MWRNQGRPRCGRVLSQVQNAVLRSHAMDSRTPLARCRFIVATVALLLSQAAAADLVSIVNDIRGAGCGRRAPAKEQVRADSALDNVARLVARGAELGAALAQSSYSAAKSTVINIGGAADDAAIREVLADGFCAAVNDRAYTAVGTYLGGNAFWLVLAAPSNRLGVGDAQTAAERVLELVDGGLSFPHAWATGRVRLEASFRDLLKLRTLMR